MSRVIVYGNNRRGHILGVGSFDDAGRPIFWMFDCGHCDPDVAGAYFGPESTLLAGWTLDELRAISQEHLAPGPQQAMGQFTSEALKRF